MFVCVQQCENISHFIPSFIPKNKNCFHSDTFLDWKLYIGHCSSDISVISTKCENGNKYWEDFARFSAYTSFLLKRLNEKSDNFRYDYKLTTGAGGGGKFERKY